MKKSYWFYLFNLWKGLSCTGVVFGCYILFSNWQKEEKLTFGDVWATTLGMAITTTYLFLIPLLLASFIRWFLQKNIALGILSFVLNYAIFLGYGYELFIGVNKRIIENSRLNYQVFAERDGKLIILMIVSTLFFLLLSEYLILRYRQHTVQKIR